MNEENNLNQIKILCLNKAFEYFFMVRGEEVPLTTNPNPEDIVEVARIFEDYLLEDDYE